jgi:hypothetical protein
VNDLLTVEQRDPPPDVRRITRRAAVALLLKHGIRSWCWDIMDHQKNIKHEAQEWLIAFL